MQGSIRWRALLCQNGVTQMVERGTPENWFVDPVKLGTAGAYNDGSDDPLAWQGDALCAETDPEAFFPEKGGSTREAKKICAQCDVKAQCLEFALSIDARFGIWGGLSERERRKLKKRA
jgi:WhiB family transcriptional regulator, redox-sensing transcriptional regulator